MKICVVHVAPDDISSPFEGVRKVSRWLPTLHNLFEVLRSTGVIRIDTQIEYRPLSKSILSADETGPFGIDWEGERHTREVLRVMLQAEKEGFDAIIDDEASDAFAKKAWNVLHVPTVPIFYAALRFVSSLRKRFAVITVDAHGAERAERTAKEYGFADSATKTDPFMFVGRKLWLDSHENPELMIEPFKNVAERCIKNGAEALIAQCGTLGPLLMVKGIRKVSGVPVIDPVTVGIKTVEEIVALQRLYAPT